MKGDALNEWRLSEGSTLQWFWASTAASCVNFGAKCLECHKIFYKSALCSIVIGLLATQGKDMVWAKDLRERSTAKWVALRLAFAVIVTSKTATSWRYVTE